MYRKKKENNLMDDDYDFGAWVTEDLKEYYQDLKKRREYTELYTDRADLNKIMHKFSREIHSRERN